MIAHQKKLPSNYVLLLLLIIIFIYVTGALCHGFLVNTDFGREDQSAYLDYAKNMKMTNYSYIGDRNRMPMYPFMLSLFYSKGMNDTQLFTRGKIFNIISSVILLIAFYIIFIYFMSNLASLTLTLLTAFTIFIYKAGYVQCELLYFFLSFCTFLLFWRSLKEPRMFLGIGAGFMAGLAYLTKAAMLPAVLCFISFYVIIYILLPLFLWLRRNMVLEPKIIFKNTLIIIVFVLSFLLILSPYISTSKRIFGQYFYNVNSTFYIWYDSWEEVEKGTKAHGDRVSWPTLSDYELPSFNKYLREHSIQQILERFLVGVKLVIKANYQSGDYFKFASLYLAIALIILYRKHQYVFSTSAGYKNHLILYYFLCYFMGYFLLYAFYTPIGDGARFTQSLVLPGMFIIFIFLQRFKTNISYKYITSYLESDKFIHVAMLILLLLDIVFFVPFKLKFLVGD